MGPKKTCPESEKRGYCSYPNSRAATGKAEDKSKKKKTKKLPWSYTSFVKFIPTYVGFNVILKVTLKFDFLVFASSTYKYLLAFLLLRGILESGLACENVTLSSK